jgi:hypothetical protein
VSHDRLQHASSRLSENQVVGAAKVSMQFTPEAAAAVKALAAGETQAVVLARHAACG